MSENFSFVIQTYLSEDYSIKNIKKTAVSLQKEIRKTTRDQNLEVYVIINEKRFVPLSKIETLKPDMEKDLLVFCKKMENLFVLFYYKSKMLWFANFRNMSKKIDFTAYGTYPKQKPGVWMSYSGGEYDEGIAHDPSTGEDGNYKDYNLSNSFAKKRNLQWIMDVLNIKEQIILKTLKK